MNRERVSFVAGFIPAAVMAMLMGAGGIFDAMTEVGELALILGKLLPFALPFAIILLVARLPREPVKLRLKGFTRHGVAFVLSMSVTAALLAFLLNSLLADLFDLSAAAQMAGRQALAGSPLWFSLLAVVLIPAVMEELVFRSGMLGCFEGYGGYAALLVSALTFALVCGIPANFPGSLAAGLIYGYMCYILDSIWPAMIAHLVKNVYDMGMSHAITAYEPLGIWPYLMLVLALVFALFLYLSMRCLEKLIKRGKVPRLRRTGLTQLAGIAASPGLWLLGLMFLFNIMYQALA